MIKLNELTNYEKYLFEKQFPDCLKNTDARDFDEFLTHIDLYAAYHSMQVCNDNWEKIGKTVDELTESGTYNVVFKEFISGWTEIKAVAELKLWKIYEEDDDDEIQRDVELSNLTIDNLDIMEYGSAIYEVTTKIPVHQIDNYVLDNSINVNKIDKSLKSEKLVTVFADDEFVNTSQLTNNFVKDEDMYIITTYTKYNDIKFVYNNRNNVEILNSDDFEEIDDLPWVIYLTKDENGDYQMSPVNEKGAIDD